MILIDLQKDFLPGGALAVPKGDEILPVLQKIIPSFDHVLATQDWHPAHHESFTLWPPHCIQNTDGAKLALQDAPIEKIFRKGTDPHIDSYSAFFDNAKKHSTGLAEYLKKHHLKTLYFAGLATDYCVLYSVLDALALGFKVWVILDACRGIDPITTGKAIQQMQAAGAQWATEGALEFRS